jgi:hypothetical protein
VVVESSGAEVVGSSAASALASAPDGPASTNGLVDSTVGAPESWDSAVWERVPSVVAGVESFSDVEGSGTSVVTVTELEKAVVLDEDWAPVCGAVGAVDVPLVAKPPVGPLFAPSLHA